MDFLSSSWYFSFVFFYSCCFFFHYVSAKFHLWPFSGDLPKPRIGMLSLVTVSQVITAFHSCCLSHHVFDRVNLWPAWGGFEPAIFWQCSPGTVETQRLDPLRHGPWSPQSIKINSQIKKPHFKMIPIKDNWRLVTFLRWDSNLNRIWFGNR